MNITVTNFNSGEVTPQVDARKDIDKYTGGCRRLDNMIPDLFGNATRRPGTELIVAGNGAACYFEGPTADPTKTQIYTPQDLQDMQNNLNGDYELMNNLDMTGFNFIPVGLWSGSGTPSATGFQGGLDGNYFTISNLTIEDPGTGVTCGLFGSTYGATIENLVLKDISYTLTNASSITAVGGLIGYAAYSTVSGTNILVSGSITYSENAFTTIGGVVGWSSSLGVGVFNKCGSNVNVNLSGTGVGSNFNNVGGFCGIPGHASYTDCYCQGTISHPGGSTLAEHGPFGGTVPTSGTPAEFVRCYGAVTPDMLFLSDRNGGFVGRDDRSTATVYTDNFWDSDLTAITTDIGSVAPLDIAGITKSTTTLMQTQSTYTDAGWDFNTIWQITEGSSYPTHQWQDISDLRTKCKQV